MTRRAKPTKRGRAAPKPAKIAAGELVTLLDFVRYAVSRFVQARLAFAHGTTDPVAEAAFVVCEALHLHPDQFEAFAAARVTAAEGKTILDLIERRVATRKPAAYLVNKIYMRGLPFYVDERVIVPRSFIGELLDSHFGADDGTLMSDAPADVDSVLDLCTGSGCLAILAARHFPNARIDAVDLSRDAIEVAARNVSEHGLADRGKSRLDQADAQRAKRPDVHRLLTVEEGADGIDKIFWYGKGNDLDRRDHLACFHAHMIAYCRQRNARVIDVDRIYC